MMISLEAYGRHFTKESLIFFYFLLFLFFLFSRSLCLFADLQFVISLVLFVWIVIGFRRSNCLLILDRDRVFIWRLVDVVFVNSALFFLWVFWYGNL